MPVSFFPAPAPGRGRRFLAPPAVLFALGLLLAACGGGGSFSAPSDSGGSSGGGASGAVVVPTLTAVVPDSGPSSGGTLVTLIGTDFSSGATVHFGMNKVTPFSVTSTAIQVFTPSHDSGTVDVWVVNPGPAAGAMFNAFTFAPPPAESLLFTNVTRAAGIDFLHTRDTVQIPVSAGLAIADFNNDGWDDFYLTNTGGPNALYLNQQDGTFTEQAAVAGVELPASIDNAACAADFDNDGDPDLYVTARGTNHLFQNNGNATFTDITAAAGVGDADRGMTCAWGDFDRDGWLDLYVTNYALQSPNLQTPDAFPDVLYRNRGDATFENVSSALPIALTDNTGFVGGWVDYDNDGDLDIYVINDFGELVQPDVLVRNDGPSATLPWTFTDVSLGSGADTPHFGMGLAVGDYDGDGWLDFYTTDIGRNELLRNNGDGTFTDDTNLAGVGRGTIPQTGQNNIGWGAFFFDFDNDGDEDLYAVAGGMNDFEGSSADVQPSALFENNGDSTFSDISSGSGANEFGRGRAAAYFDFDNDGDLDILVNRYNQSPVLLRNDQTTGNAWLLIRLVGNTSNRGGIGARIHLTAGGVAQIREVRSGSSHCGNNMLAVHFGLGANETVSQLEVRWPSGAV